MKNDLFGELVLAHWLKMSKLEELKLQVLAANPQVFGVAVGPDGQPIPRVVESFSKPKIRCRSIDDNWEI